MKHAILLSSTAALSLAACAETTAPERQHVDVPAQNASQSFVASDSSVAWAAAALDDAASRLAQSISNERARRELSGALHALSTRLRSPDGAKDSELNALSSVARRAVQRVQDSDPSVAADLDAITLALENASTPIRLLETRRSQR